MQWGSIAAIPRALGAKPSHRKSGFNHMTCRALRFSRSISFDKSPAPPRSSPSVINRTTAPRHKIPVAKGFGLADWNKLLQKSTDLAQRRGQPLQRYRWSDVKPHKHAHDGWVVLRNKVYNVSPYLAYHPGGADILRKCLGKDITALYDKYHPWVNEEG